MAETEQEYISILRSILAETLPDDEVKDILSDFTGHFHDGREVGRTEEGICRSLGDPETIAEEIRAAHAIFRAGRPE